MSVKLSILLIPIFLIFGFVEKPQTVEQNNNVSATVYVCGKSKIYHNSRSHSALSRCTSGITKMSDSRARGLGKRLCKCRN